MKLSILICSLYERKIRLEHLLEILLPQIGEFSFQPGDVSHYTGEKVEILICTDNKELKVGAKRNKLVESAKGDYVSFIDDDDIVSGEYVHSILNATKFSPDVINFWAYRFHNGKRDRRVDYDIKYDCDKDRPNIYQRMPNHLSVWKRSLVLPYKEINYGEDAEWAARMKGKALTQRKIDKILYSYLFDQDVTQTQNF